MKLKYMKMTLLMGFVWGMSVPAWAGFDVTKMTTVVDDLSGSYTVSKSGRLEEMKFTGTSLTEFNQFHPASGEEDATITGVISKQTDRTAGALETHSDGAFVLESNDGTWDVSFIGLVVNASDSGAALSGSVSVNDDTFEADELPEKVAYLLRRVFWLTRR